MTVLTRLFGANATLTAKVEKIEGGWAEFAFTATVVPGTPSNVFADGTTGADITTGTLPNGNYRVTVTLSNNNHRHSPLAMQRCSLFP